MDRNPFGQILLSALLGATPGCVGVFAVVSLFTHNIVGFGALMAACIASFGDEAFFLFSLSPSKALLTTGILWLTGLVVGCGCHFLKPFQSTRNIHQLEHLVLHEEEEEEVHSNTSNEKSRFPYRLMTVIYLLLFISSIAFGWVGEENEQGFSGENAAFVGIALCVLIMLLFTDNHFLKEHLWQHILKKHLLKIFLWTFGVLLFIGLLENHLDLWAFSQQNRGKYLLLGIALLIGLIPQSGPHLAVIQLFMAGILPYSTLLANCLLQEGHGGIPLMAETPRTFLKLKGFKFILAALVGLAGIWMGW